MACDYEDLHARAPNALGAQTKTITTVLDSYALKQVRILDVGCGQGRDALPPCAHTFINAVSPNGWLILADETSNLLAFCAALAADARTWIVERRAKGLLFTRTTG